MGNIIGLRMRKGGHRINAVSIAPVLQAALDARFPTGLAAVVVGTGEAYVGVHDILRPNTLLFVWGPQYNGSFGCKHPHTGKFLEWLHFVAVVDTARGLGARVHDEGIGFWHDEEIERGMPSFPDYIAKLNNNWFWKLFLRGDETKHVVSVAPSLVPYARGEVK